MPTITDATVVAQAYDTSGNGGRKLVRLDNGNLISIVKNTSTLTAYIYKSLDGITWSQLCYFSLNQLGDIAIQSNGTYLYVICATTNKRIAYFVVNTDTQSNVDISSSYAYVEQTDQAALGNVSLAINEAKTELHATWASKNSTYPNSFNIRYAKGTINGDGTVTWGAVEQRTTYNTTGSYNQNPSITLNALGKPIILCEQYTGIAYYINALVYNGSTWTEVHVYPSANQTYTQSSPSAIFVPQSINGLENGLMANVWHGTDSTSGGVNYIRFSKSNDGGATWSTMQKLVVGTNATLTANKSGKLFITYEDAGVTKRIESSDNGDTWSSAVTVGTGTNPSSLFDLRMSFSAPLTIRKGTSSVLFSGTWTVTTISVTPGDIGQKTDKNNILSYSITTDGEMSTITEKINGTVVNTRNTTSGQAVTLGLTQAQWDAIRFGKYADTTGGKNTLTVEMGSEKWTYTFDKQLASDSDIISASKAVKDANEVYLPSVKKQLADAINNKGGSVSANADWLTMIDGMKTSNSTRTLSGTVTSTSTNYPFVAASGTSVNLSKCTVTGLPFNPSMVLMWNSSLNVQSAMYVKEGLHYFGGLAVAACGANYYRADNISNVLGFVLPVLAGNTIFNWVAYE